MWRAWAGGFRARNSASSADNEAPSGAEFESYVAGLDPLIWYRLNELSGDAVDAESVLNGSYVGGSSRGQAPLVAGTGANYSSRLLSDGHIETPNDPAIALGEYSIFMAIAIPALKESGKHICFSRGSGSSMQGEVSLEVVPGAGGDADVRAYVRDSSLVVQEALAEDVYPSTPAQTLVHTLALCVSAANGLEVYFNGVLVASNASGTQGWDDASMTAPMVIGAYISSGSGVAQIDGNVDEFMLFDRRLLSSEVLTLDGFAFATPNYAPTVVQNDTANVQEGSNVLISPLNNDTIAGSFQGYTLDTAGFTVGTVVVEGNDLRITGVTAGTQNFSYQVTDANGLSGSAQVNVTVTAAPPTQDLSPQQAVWLQDGGGTVNATFLNGTDRIMADG